MNRWLARLGRGPDQPAVEAGRTTFFTVDIETGVRVGELVEYDVTEKVSTSAGAPRTEADITGRFGWTHDGWDPERIPPGSCSDQTAARSSS